MRYAKENVVLLKVPHVRVMDGETDTVVARTKTDACTNEIMNLLEAEGVKEPDWFVERWVDEEKQLYVVAVFEDVRDANAFVAAMLEAKLDYVWCNTGSPEYEAFLAKEAEAFSAEWERAHEESLKRCRAAVDAGIKVGAFDDVVIARKDVDCGDKPDPQKEFAAFGKKLNECLATEDDEKKCAFKYAPVFVKDEGVFVIGLKFETSDDKKFFMEHVDPFDGWMFAEAGAVIKSVESIDSREKVYEAYLRVFATVAGIVKKEPNKETSNEETHKADAV